MLLQNSQFIIQIVLIIVIITGIISSRMIVGRLKVIRASYASLNEMVGALDSSIEQADKIFETLRREVSKGDKRLSVLLDHARNMEEDLADQHKMAQESSASLEEILQKGQKREQILSHTMREAQSVGDELQEHVAQAERVTRRMADLLKEVEAARAAMSLSPKAEDMPQDHAEAPPEGEGNERTDKERDAEQGTPPQFVDDIAMPVPDSMRAPRPYLRRSHDNKERVAE